LPIAREGAPLEQVTKEKVASSEKSRRAEGVAALYSRWSYSKGSAGLERNADHLDNLRYGWVLCPKFEFGGCLGEISWSEESKYDVAELVDVGGIGSMLISWAIAGERSANR
jgi:hypothetical protein